jgi:hypothetical protein
MHGEEDNGSNSRGKKAIKIVTTGITAVLFREGAVPDIYIRIEPLAKVLETLPKA